MTQPPSSTPTVVRARMAAVVTALLLWPLAACAQRAAPLASRSGPIHGLVAMGSMRWRETGGPPPNALEEPLAHPGIYEAAVCDLRWSDLEPVRGDLNTASLDACLSAIARYNARYPATPMRAKLRVFGGESAPDWAKALSGPPLQLVAVKSGEFTAGRWWAPAYLAAWDDLQARLARAYDDNPLIAEVAVTGCAVRTAEPFIVPAADADRPILVAAGYSDAAEMTCLRDWRKAYAGWTKPALDYTFSPFRSLGGGVAPQPDKVLMVMGEFRQALGTRGVIANHALQAPVPAHNAEFYDGFRRYGGPIEFQFVSQAQQTDAAFALGRSYGMTELEVFDTRAAGGFADTDTAQLRAWSAALGGY